MTAHDPKDGWKPLTNVADWPAKPTTYSEFKLSDHLDGDPELTEEYRKAMPSPYRGVRFDHPGYVQNRQPDGSLLCRDLQTGDEWIMTIGVPNE